MKKSAIFTLILTAALLSSCNNSTDTVTDAADHTTADVTTTDESDLTTEAKDTTESETTESAPETEAAPPTEPIPFDALTEDNIIGKLQSVTVAKVGGVVMLYKGEECISFGEYTDVFALDREGDPVYYAAVEAGEMLCLHEIYVSGRISEEFVPFKTVKRHGRYILTDTGLYDGRMNAVVYHSYYPVDFNVDEIGLNEDGIGYKLTGTDNDGNKISVTCEQTTPNTDEYRVTESDIKTEGVIRARISFNKEVDGKSYTITTDAPVRSDVLISLGDYVSIKYSNILFNKNGEIALEVEPVCNLDTVGDVIYAYDAYEPQKIVRVYNSELEVLYDGELYSINTAALGGYTAKNGKDGDTVYFDEDFNVIEVEIVTVASINDLTVTKENGVVKVYLDKKLISDGIYKDAFTLEGQFGKLIYVTVEKSDGTFSVHQLYSDGSMESRGISGITKLEQLGNYLLVNGKDIYNSSLNSFIYIYNYVDEFEMTDFRIYDDGYSFLLNGKDKNGNAIYISYDYNNAVDYVYSNKLSVDTDPYRVILKRSAFVDGKYRLLTVDKPVQESDIKVIGDYIYTYDSFIKDGEIKLTLDIDYYPNIVGDFIAIYSGPSDIGPVYNMDLEPIFDGELMNFTKLSDGRYIARANIDEIIRAVVFDADGKLVYQSEADRKCLLTGEDYMLSSDADGVIRLYTPDNELLCEFTEWKEDFYFHSMLSGRYEKDGKTGYYFVTENPNDTKPWSQDAEHGEYGSRIWEFYYIPETDESGVIDNGYGDFAYAKPVLYLYPETETEITVTFDHPDRLTTVYPAYNNAWHITAKPDGTLTDERGRTYYALYWEEDSGVPIYRFSDGFCVKGEDSVEFLEYALDAIGFTERESNEFIIYWLPIMELNEYNLIRFELTAEREATNGLNIKPAPDSLLRMAMHIKAVDTPVEIPEQPLSAFARNGFVAVEWGGCIH